eukprot:m.68949 g.68949  ORF g.68949 m.68949 type:complete len:479 (-) comp14101_c0_seq2:56-1492(-)
MVRISFCVSSITFRSLLTRHRDETGTGPSMVGSVRYDGCRLTTLRAVTMSKFSALFGGEEELTSFHSALKAIAGEREVQQRQNVGIGLSLRRRKPKLQDPLTKKLRELAQVNHLKRHTRQAVDSEQIKQLWQVLQTFSTVQLEDGQPGITYSKFIECRKAASQAFGASFDLYFRPFVFQGLHRHPPHDAVAIEQFYNFVVRGSANERYRLSFVPYDSNHTGVLSLDDFESWLRDRLETFPQLADMAPSFNPTYVIYSAAKVFFLLDHSRTRKVKIPDLLSSAVFAELMELQQQSLPEEQAETNWFSIPFVTSVHTQYMELDKDKDGLLSFEELCNLDNRSISPVFVQRLLQEYPTFDGKADYRLFLELVLARMLPKLDQSIRFYFRVFDIDRKGYLTTTSLLYFWRGMHQHPQMEEDALEADFFENIKNEIFDMIRPKDPFKITLQDIIASQQGAALSLILTDVVGFGRYENRESVPI